MSKVFIEESTLTSIGDAIREKTGKTDLIPTTEMANEISEIKTGEEVYYTPAGVPYTAVTKIINNTETNYNRYPSQLLAYADKLIELHCDWKRMQGGGNTNIASYSSVQRVFFPKLNYTNSHACRECLNLVEAVIGSIGNPVGELSVYVFSGCKNPDLVVTVYVDANTLAEIPTTVSNNKPWGATNATIIFRNSTTGEVITE